MLQIPTETRQMLPCISFGLFALICDFPSFFMLKLNVKKQKNKKKKSSGAEDWG